MAARSHGAPLAGPTLSDEPLTLAWLATADAADIVAALGGLYEHSPWIVASALAWRPFAGLAAFKQAMVTVVRSASREAQVALVRAHPELGGKAAIAGTLTTESTNEQQRAGLSHCTPAEFAQIQALNADYGARFGWPFVLAVRGPRGTGLSRFDIIGTLQRRLVGQPDDELAECLRQIHRIAELRLNDRFGHTPVDGDRVWDWAAALAMHSDPGHRERGELTVHYLTDAHQACARQLQAWMREVGCDNADIDAVGNVVGVYRGSDPDAPRLLTGSHYDTVRNGGRHDGRLGILVALAAVQRLSAAGRRLAHGIEIVAFAEEEGQRYKATFLGSSALVGRFDPAWLAQEDEGGVQLDAAMRAAGLPATMNAIAACRRDPAHYLGYVEVHIEQGPVLVDADLPLGVVTSINGSVRYLGEVQGVASHAGTTPMDRRRDAAAAVAELVLYVESLAAQAPDLVGTVGILTVPNGSINVVPGHCRFSLDLRATTDAVRDAMAADVRAELAAICARRHVASTLTETVRAGAAPCDPAWQRRWEDAVAAIGQPVFHLPSGAGHDAMMLHHLLPQAMLFVRGQNGGISHSPLEETTSDDAQSAVDAFAALLDGIAGVGAPPSEQTTTTPP